MDSCKVEYQFSQNLLCHKTHDIAKRKVEYAKERPFMRKRKMWFRWRQAHYISSPVYCIFYGVNAIGLSLLFYR